MNTPHQPMQILVTGGGLSGSGGHRAAAGARRSRAHLRARRLPDLAARGVTVCRGDLTDSAAVIAACHGCEAVLHMAAKAGISVHYGDYHAPNVVGTENLLAGCREQGVQRLVFTSSPSVVLSGRDMEGVNESAPYPVRHMAHYPRTKAIADSRCLRPTAAGCGRSRSDRT